MHEPASSLHRQRFAAAPFDLLMEMQKADWRLGPPEAVVQMNQLRIVVDCSSMFISTQFARFNKAVEHFYYALLFSSDDYAGSSSKAWDSWAEQGFDLAVRAAPPAVREGDRLIVDWRPGRSFELTVATNNRAALTRLAELLREIESARTVLTESTEDARVQALLDNPALNSRLLRPVRESLERGSIPHEAADAIRSILKQGLSALTNRQIESVKLIVD